jgi:putative inorganic carbon (HCO3(-)) transporter
MRFYLYAGLLIALVPVIFARPFFGLCVYLVVSLLQPKVLCWSPGFQDAMLVGVPMVIGAIAIGVRRKLYMPQRDPSGRIAGIREIFSRSPLFEMSWPLLLFAVLVGYVTFTRLIVPYSLDETTFQYRSLCKILFVTVLLTGLVSDFRRFRIAYIVIALSVAFWAIKGGIKVILLGPHQVYGRTFDNNLFALTSVMALPMVFYFGLSVKHARWRLVMMTFSALICLSIIGSRSRAGFVALVVVLIGMTWSSRYRLRALFAVATLGVAALAWSGQEVRDRIDSIAQFQQDKSAISRFETWDSAMKLLRHSPAIGVGFSNFEIAKDQFIGGRKAAHNIYLQNLAELGLVGHPIWLAIVLGTLGSAYLFMLRARRLPGDMRWAYYWSRGICLAMLGFCIHGTFHNEQYLELMFTLVGLNVALHAVTRREIQSRRLFAAVERTANAPARSVTPPPRASALAHPGMLTIPAGLRSLAGRAMCMAGGWRD